MKFLHIADLHLGKALHGYSLIDQGDQPEWIEGFLALADQVRPDAVVIAGDVYDRAVPSREAIALLDDFLTRLHARNIPVLLVSGNHDSGPRLHFASAMLEKQGIHIAGTVEKEMRRVTICDEIGPVHFYVMPYIFPAAVEEVIGAQDLHTYDAAARALLAVQEIDPAQRNVLVAHQLVLGGAGAPEMGGSETMVGGVGQIDYSAFDAFDYVALGHIHRAQAMGRETVRYAGSPMCYHFSEIGWKKGPLLVEMGAKGEEIRVEMLEIPPKHPLRQLRGTLAEILAAENESPTRNSFVRVVLTDRELPVGVVDTLQAVFQANGSILMETVRDYRFERGEEDERRSARREKSLEELFAEFYRMRAGDFPDAQTQNLIEYAGDLLAHADAEDPAAYARKIVDYAMKQEG